MTVQLHQFVIEWDLPNPSPFCLKAETWLRMAGIEYETVAWNPMGAPNGKAPFVVVDGETIPDSGRIIAALTERFDVAMDHDLTPEQHATGRLVVRTLEEHTYFVLVCDRWLQDEAWSSYREVIGQPIPGLIRRPMTWWLRRGMRQACWGHGIGRHPIEEIRRRGISDVDAVLTVLGDQPYLLGDQPTSYDATVYAWLAVLAHPIGVGPFAEHCRSHPVAAAYLRRMQDRYWQL